MTHIPLAVYPKFDDVSLYTWNRVVTSIPCYLTQRNVAFDYALTTLLTLFFFPFVIFFHKPHTVHRRAHQSITQNAHIIIHNRLYMKKNDLYRGITKRININI